jgi:hypothetical protein
MTDHERGQWEAFNRVLALLNTLEDVLVDKAFLYRIIMQMYPAKEAA